MLWFLCILYVIAITLVSVLLLSAVGFEPAVIIVDHLDAFTDMLFLDDLE